MKKDRLSRSTGRRPLSVGQHCVCMQIRAIIIILYIPLLQGCMSSRNISKLDPFCDFVDQTVELRRPVCVVHHCNTLMGGTGVDSFRSARHGLVDHAGQWDGEVLAQLPKGHRVTLTAVRDEVYFDSETIVAYGHTIVPPGTNEVSFAYHWGYYWELRRAPWELDDTPPRRGPPGKLPPHFDYDMFRSPPDIPKWGTGIKK